MLEAMGGREEPDQREGDTTGVFVEDVSGSEYDRYRALVKGVVALVFAKRAKSGKSAKSGKNGKSAGTEGGNNVTDNVTDDVTDNVTDVTLLQQHRALCCLSALCKDEALGSPQQTLEADIMCQIAVGEGCLMAW